MTDEKILDLLEHKPEEGAKLLMEKYLPAVRNVCAKRLCDQEDVKECVNDVFAEFCLKYPKYDIEKGNIKNYLCTIAKRRSIDKYRKNSRNKETEYKIYEQYKEEIDERDSREEMSRRLDEAMEKLEPLDREILEKYYYEGFSYTEIAKELNLNYETVKKRGVRGRKKLLYLILIGILMFGITACTTVVLKQQGLLPVWFPFYEMIPPVEKEEMEESESKKELLYIEGGELDEPEADEETYLDEETPENDVKKYYVSDGQGLIWSEDEAFEMKNSTEKIQRDDIIYELENVFYQNGVWEIHLIITCTDKQKTTITNKDEEQIKNEESWINEEFTYLNQAYLLLKGIEKHYLSEYEYRWIKGSEYTVRDKYRVSMKTTGIYENTDVCIVLPDGKKIEIVMDKINSKDYIENDEQGLKVGVAERINGQLILSLHSEQTEEYQIAARITQDYFGPLVTENKTLSLLDENGNSCSPNRINTKDLDGEKIYEVYFPEKDPGNYTLHIPYLCVLKNMKTETVEIPMPTGEDTEISCEIPVTFPDGTGFVIQRVIRYEETGYVYHVIEDQLVIEEVKTWMYELKYNTEEDGEMIFNVAKAAGTTSENDGVHAAIRVVDNETKYILETNSDKIASSVSVEFYEPLYLWNKEMFLDVLIN